MSKPIISSALPDERAFYLKRSMFEDRLDPEYYSPKHYRLLGQMVASGRKISRLREIAARVVDGPFGSDIKASDYAETGIPFLRVADVTRGEGAISMDDLAFITEDAHRRIPRSTVRPGDIVIAKTGATMGAASLIPEGFPEANIRADLAAVTLYDKDLAQYLVNYINSGIGQQLFWRLNSGATRGRVVIQNLLKYPIVLPSEKIRNQINEAVKYVRLRKGQSEKEVANLLQSIDHYLLNELGIPLVHDQLNNLPSRIFFSKSSRVTGRRFDPRFHHPKFERLITALHQSPFEKVRLGRIAPRIVGGATPEKSNRDLYAESGVKFLRIMNIGFNEVDLTDLVYITDDVHDGYLKRSQLRADDVLMTITGRVGNAAVVTSDLLPANINQHIVVLRISDSRIYPEYLSAYLNSSIGLSLSNRGVTGGTRIALDYGTIRGIEVPVPPKTVQERIILKNIEIREKIADLRAKEAANTEATKHFIQDLILGKVQTNEAQRHP